MNKIKKTIQLDIHPNQLRQFQAVMTNLFKCCQERMQYQSNKFNLPDAEMRCLMLFEADKYLTPKNIAAKMNVVKSRITKIIDGLVKRGIIKKTKDPGDSRVTLLSLTLQGKNKLKEILEFNNCLHREVLIAMGPEQRRIILTSLDMLKNAMDSAKGLIIHGTEVPG